MPNAFQERKKSETNAAKLPPLSENAIVLTPDWLEKEAQNNPIVKDPTNIVVQNSAPDKVEKNKVVIVESVEGQKSAYMSSNEGELKSFNLEDRTVNPEDPSTFLVYGKLVAISRDKSNTTAIFLDEGKMHRYTIPANK